MNQDSQQSRSGDAHKYEWRNPWFGGPGWTPCKAESLQEAARELPMPHHEETTLREVATGQIFSRGGL